MAAPSFRDQKLLKEDTLVTVIHHAIMQCMKFRLSFVWLQNGRDEPQYRCMGTGHVTLGCIGSLAYP